MHFHVLMSIPMGSETFPSVKACKHISMQAFTLESFPVSMTAWTNICTPLSLEVSQWQEY